MSVSTWGSSWFLPDWWYIIPLRLTQVQRGGRYGKSRSSHQENALALLGIFRQVGWSVCFVECNLYKLMTEKRRRNYSAAQKMFFTFTYCIYKLISCCMLYCIHHKYHYRLYCRYFQLPCVFSWDANIYLINLIKCATHCKAVTV